jgi:hypothetical protein
VKAAQIDPNDYPATPAEGILQVCQLSGAQLALTKAFEKSRTVKDRNLGDN